MIDDPTLLRCYLEDRSEPAFADLVHRHLSLVYFAALRQMGGDTHAAEDVTQRVFTLLARRAAALTLHPALAGWLFHTTRFMARDARRAARRRQRREQEAQTMQDLLADPAPPVDWGRLRPVLDDALAALNARDREAILLRVFQARSFAEVGAALRVSEDAARMRVERALEKLRRLLTRRGITSPTAALSAALALQAGAAVPAGLAASVTGTALAAVAAGGGALATAALTFMTTSKAMLGAATILAVAGIGSAVYEHREVREDASVLASVSRERDTLRSRVTRLESQVNEAARATPTAQTQAAQAPARPSPATRSSGSMAWDSVPPQLFRNPDFVKLFLKKYQAQLRLDFAPLYRTLHLTPAQIAGFEDHMIAAQAAICQVLAAADAAGTSGAEPAVVDVAAEKQSEAFSQVHALLGDAGFRQFQQYLLSLVGIGGPSPRELMASMAGDLSLSGAPLTADQGDQLLQL